MNAERGKLSGLYIMDNYGLLVETANSLNQIRTMLIGKKKTEARNVVPLLEMIMMRLEKDIININKMLEALPEYFDDISKEQIEIYDGVLRESNSICSDQFTEVDFYYRRSLEEKALRENQYLDTASEEEEADTVPFC